MLRFSPAAWHPFADQVKRSLASDLQRGRPARSGWHRTGACHPSVRPKKSGLRAAGQALRPAPPHGGRRV